MAQEIRRDFRNEMLKRRELEFVVSSATNPGFGGAKSAVVEKFKVDENKTVVKFVKNNFGANDFLIGAFIYDSAEDLVKVEPKRKEKKSGGAA